MNGQINDPYIKSRLKKNSIIYPVFGYCLKANTVSNCVLCKITTKEKNLIYFIQSKLYQKYSSSQNYYYTRDINAIITKKETAANINYLDLRDFDKKKEFLRRIYKIHEYKGKITLQTEYYKYHNEIPRCFMVPHGDQLAIYHDKKRNIEYHRIKHLLSGKGQDDKNGQQSDSRNYSKNKQDTYRAKNEISYEKWLKDQTFLKNKQYNNNFSKNNNFGNSNLKLTQKHPNIKETYMPLNKNYISKIDSRTSNLRLDKKNMSDKSQLLLNSQIQNIKDPSSTLNEKNCEQESSNTFFIKKSKKIIQEIEGISSEDSLLHLKSFQKHVKSEKYIEDDISEINLENTNILVTSFSEFSSNDFMSDNNGKKPNKQLNLLKESDLNLKVENYSNIYKATSSERFKPHQKDSDFTERINKNQMQFKKSTVNETTSKKASEAMKSLYNTSGKNLSITQKSKNTDIVFNKKVNIQRSDTQAHNLVFTNKSRVKSIGNSNGPEVIQSAKSKTQSTVIPMSFNSQKNFQDNIIKHDDVNLIHKDYASPKKYNMSLTNRGGSLKSSIHQNVMNGQTTMNSYTQRNKENSNNNIKIEKTVTLTNLKLSGVKNYDNFAMHKKRLTHDNSSDTEDKGLMLTSARHKNFDLMQKHKSVDDPMPFEFQISNQNNKKSIIQPNFITGENPYLNSKNTNQVSTKETNFIIKKIQGLGVNQELSNKNINSNGSVLNMKNTRREWSKEDHFKSKMLKNERAFDVKKKSGPVALSARPGQSMPKETFLINVNKTDNKRKLIESTNINNQQEDRDFSRKSLQWHTHTLSDNKRKISQEGAKKSRLNINFFNRNHKFVK